MKLRNILAGAGCLAALALATSASAYDLGVLAIGSPLSQSVTDPAGPVDDVFNFSIQPPPLSTYGQLIDFFVAGKNGSITSNVFTSGTISLYNAADTLLDQVDLTIIPGGAALTPTDSVNLQPGDYHFVVDGVMAAPGGNYTFGVFGAAVPEPAAWAMMIVGVGLIGATLRVRARREENLTVA